MKNFEKIRKRVNIQQLNKAAILQNKSFQAIVALIVAFGCWWWHESSIIVVQTYTVPCCFYGYENKKITDAPEQIEIMLCGKKRDLRHLDKKRLAVHIDVSRLDKGAQRLEVDHRNLFLPPTVRLIEWFPSNACIVVS